MKNKKVVYLLILVIAGIWAFILYRFFAFSSSPNNPEFQALFVPPVLTSTTSDTFSISANYRDPFLGKTETKVESNRPKTTPVPKKVVELLKWPAITYGGMIKNRKSNAAQLCMVVINGQSNFMKEGDIIADVQLKKVYKDSVEVVFQKDKKMIKK